MEDLAGGAFQEVIDDTIDPKKVKRVILCSGKFYYDLLEERENRGDTTTAIIRLEQLYPLRQSAITEITKKYKHLEAFVWAQEEPANSGAWTYLLWQFPYKLKLASPPASAAPAPGSYKIAAKRHAAAIELAFKS